MEAWIFQGFVRAKCDCSSMIVEGGTYYTASAENCRFIDVACGDGSDLPRLPRRTRRHSPLLMGTDECIALYCCTAASVAAAVGDIRSMHLHSGSSRHAAARILIITLWFSIANENEAQNNFEMISCVETHTS